VLSLNPDMVDMSDGVFEVLLIKPLNSPKAVYDCVSSLINQNYNSEYITFFNAGRAVVYSDPKMNWALDGERANGRDRIDIKNLNKAVRVISK